MSGVRVLGRAQIEALHEVLARTGCQFFACPGPAEEHVDMATCIVCTHEAALGIVLGRKLDEDREYHQSHYENFFEGEEEACAHMWSDGRLNTIVSCKLCGQIK